jgi:hypothetical protein
MLQIPIIKDFLFLSKSKFNFTFYIPLILITI